MWKRKYPIPPIHPIPALNQSRYGKETFKPDIWPVFTIGLNSRTCHYSNICNLCAGRYRRYPGGRYRDQKIFRRRYSAHVWGGRYPRTNWRRKGVFQMEPGRSGHEQSGGILVWKLHFFSSCRNRYQGFFWCIIIQKQKICISN